MKNKLTVILFIFFITGSLLFNLILSDKDISYSERRKLFMFTDISYDSKFSEDFEKYALDQFCFRDYFRKLKGIIELNVFRKLDNGGLYMIGDHVFKMEYPLNEKSINSFGEKINMIKELYLKDNDVYYSLVPDKNYFIKDDKLLTIDYSIMERMVKAKVDEGIIYIDLFDSLTLDDYYLTDHHWKQSNLKQVLNSLSQAMNFENDYDLSDYSEKSYFPFYGAYYGQSAISLAPEKLIYLDNEDLQNLKISIIEDFTSTSIESGAYDEKALGDIDSYDMFLYGSKPIIIIENENPQTDRELIVFKDSFANSLVPLMTSQYRTITLIDLRLVNHSILDQFIDFDNQEVLFLYSTLIVNNSEILK